MATKKKSPARRTAPGAREDALLRSLCSLSIGELPRTLQLGVAALRPGMVVRELRSTLDIDDFAAKGHCTFQPLPGVYQQFEHWVDVAHGRLHDMPRAVWFTVDWRGHRIELAMAEVRYADCPYSVTVAASKDGAALDAFLVAITRFMHEVRDQVLVYQSGYWDKNAALHRAVRETTFDSLVLPPGVAERIRGDFLRFKEAKDAYARHGVPWKRGVLFLGPPGNGKTHCIKAVANHLGWPALYVRSLVSQDPNYHNPIRDVFKRAREMAPCLLIFEDLDSMVGPKTLSYFLNELDGFSSNEGIVTVASTNYPERLDPALVNRPSRFDVKYSFDLPAAQERRAFLSLWNRRTDVESRFSDESLDQLAVATADFSFAFLKELEVSTLMQWMAEERTRPFGTVALDLVPVLRLQLTRELAAPPPVPEQVVLPEFDA